MRQSRSFVYDVGPVAVARIPTFLVLITVALGVPATAEEPPSPIGWLSPPPRDVSAAREPEEVRIP
jgi:hypothetical protein